VGPEKQIFYFFAFLRVYVIKVATGANSGVLGFKTKILVVLE